MAKATTIHNKKEPQPLKRLKPQKRLKLFCHTTTIRSILHGFNGEYMNGSIRNKVRKEQYDSSKLVIFVAKHASKKRSRQ